MRTYDEAKRKLEEEYENIFEQTDPRVNSIGIGKDDKGYYLEIGSESGSWSFREETKMLAKEDFKLIKKEVYDFQGYNDAPEKNLPVEPDFPIIRPGLGVMNQVCDNPGTITAIVKKGKDKYILSCNHILNHNGCNSKAISLYTANKRVDEVVIGTLTEAGEEVGLDCAIARLDDSLKTSDKVINLEVAPKHIVYPSIGLAVVKYGDRTKRTIGYVSLVDVIIRGSDQRYFQINPVGNCGNFVNDGDSGALLLALDNTKPTSFALGLLSKRSYQDDGGQEFNGAFAIPMIPILDYFKINL